VKAFSLSSFKRQDKKTSSGYRHGEMSRFCDSHTSVFLRRKRNCIFRMPGLCPGRSFCCLRMK
uniref:Uncharacterized protein n=1 Tax=Panthera leo TaxID=9689 RepID=A0A8C8X9E4_PANLE